MQVVPIEFMYKGIIVLNPPHNQTSWEDMEGIREIMGFNK